MGFGLGWMSANPSELMFFSMENCFIMACFMQSMPGEPRMPCPSVALFTKEAMTFMLVILCQSCCALGVHLEMGLFGDRGSFQQRDAHRVLIAQWWNEVKISRPYMRQNILCGLSCDFKAWRLSREKLLSIKPSFINSFECLVSWLNITYKLSEIVLLSC